MTHLIKYVNKAKAGSRARLAVFFAIDLRVVCIAIFIFTSSFCMKLLAEPAPLQLLIQTPIIAPVLSLSASTTEWLAQRASIRVATWGEAYPPFDVPYQEGNFEGLTADFLGVLQQSLNSRLIIFRYPDQSSAEEALQRDEIDILAMYVANARKTKDVIASEPYLLNQAVLVKRIEEQPTEAKGSSNQRIAVAANQKPEAIDFLNRNYPDISIVLYNSHTNAMASLIYGQVDALWSDAASADYLLKRAYFNRAYIVPNQNQFRLNMSFGVNSKNLPLLDGINQVIKAIPQAGRLRIATRWSLGANYVQAHSALALSPNEQQWLLKHPLVRIAVTGTDAPLTFFDESGDFRGLTADMLQQIQQRTNVKFWIVHTHSPAESLKLLLSGKVDAIGASPIGDIDKKNIKFTRPYLVNPMVLMTQKTLEPIQALSQLNDKRLAINENSSMIQWLREQHPRIDLIFTENSTKAAELLVDGSVDASVNNQIGAEYFIQNFFRHQLRINTNIGVKLTRIAFAVREDEPELLSVLNKALLDIPPEEQAHIVDRWRNHATPPAASSWSSYQDIFYKSVGGMSVLAILFLAWNGYLRKQIQQRKVAELALQDQLQFTRTLIDGSPVALYVRDQEGLLLQCNQSYLDFLKIERKSVIGKRLDESAVLSADFNKQYHILYQQILTNGIPKFSDVEVPIRNEIYRIYHWAIPYMNSTGDIVGIIGGWVDITDREQLIIELRKAKEQADAANISKTTFLASMSHEIRTPMNAIVGLLELLHRRGGSAAELNNNLAIAHESAQSLLSLIGDILDLSKIESGAMKSNPQPTIISTILENTFNLFENDARQKNLEMRLIIEIDNKCVLIDQLMIKQIVSNLLSNAIKFTQTGIIEVTLFENVSTTKPGVASFTIQVIDSGIGLSEAQIQTIYEPFVQVCNNSLGTGGTGLGLSICRRLAGILGGTIEVSSEENIGSTFTFHFDAQISSAESCVASSPLDTYGTSRSMHILIADDHAANRLLLCQQLEFAGHTVESAENGETALALWERSQHAYDLIITDCNMPKLDGLQLTKKLRSLEIQYDSARVPILGLTANAQAEMIVTCKAAGMNDCLFKPINFDDLNSRIRLLFPTPSKNAPKTVFSLSNAQNALEIESFIEEVIRSNADDATALNLFSIQGNTIELSRLAHRIKGAIKYVGADTVAETCDRLQDYATQGDVLNCQNIVKTLLAELKQLEIELQNRITHIKLQ